MLERAIKEEGHEDEDVDLPFPDFSWPEGLTAVGMVSQGRIGIDDAEIPSCRMAKGIAVHEVSHAADRLAEDDGWREEVPKGPCIDVVDAGIDDAGNGAKEKAPLNGHAPLPDEGDFREVIMVVRPVEEEDVPEAAADDAGEAAIHGEIKHVDVPAPAVPFHNIVGHEARRNDAEHEE